MAIGTASRSRRWIRFGLRSVPCACGTRWRQADLASRGAGRRGQRSRPSSERRRRRRDGRPAACALPIALERDLDIRLRWRGEALDRLLDEAHAGLVEDIVMLLRAEGWEVAVEVSFSICGERGSIDVLASTGRSGILLVVEVKSVVPDSQATLHGAGSQDAAGAARLAGERGWDVAAVARLLVVGDRRPSRRRDRRASATTYATALPVRAGRCGDGFAGPSGPMAGLAVPVILPLTGDARSTGDRPCSGSAALESAAKSA